MSRLNISIIFIVVTGYLMVSSNPSTTFAQQPGVMELATKMPNDANAVMVLNVAEIRNSSIAKQNGWFNSSAGKIESGMNLVPMGTNIVLLSASMDYQTFSARWTAALATKNQVPTVEQIRELTDGQMDEVTNTRFVETPDDYFVFPVTDTTIAAFQPALRQVFTRWMRRIQSGDDVRIRDYLEKGLGFAEEGTDLVLAFNLQHSVSRTRIAERSRDSELLRTNSILPRDFSRMMASVQGVTLKATVADKINCEIKMEFGEDASMLQPIVGPLVKELAGVAGVYLKEFEQWTPVIEGDTISVSGELSVSSFRKIISLIDGPRSEAVATSAEYSEQSNDDPVVATKNYFASVNSLVEDVRPRLTTGQALSRNARWLTAYADKIDNLPILNVDPLMLDFGNFVSQSLRDASLGVINTRENIRTEQGRLLASGARSGGGRSWRSTGGGSRRVSGRGDGSRLRSAARQSQMSGAVVEMSQIFSDIASVTRDVRRQMTDKFGVQF